MLKRSLSRHHQGTLNGAPVRQRFMSPQQSTEVPGANCSAVSTSQPFRPKTKRFSMLTRNRCSYRGLNNYNRAFGGHYTIYLQEGIPKTLFYLLRPLRLPTLTLIITKKRLLRNTRQLPQTGSAPAAGVSVPLSQGFGVQALGFTTGSGFFV